MTDNREEDSIKIGNQKRKLMQPDSIMVAQLIKKETIFLSW